MLGHIPKGRICYEKKRQFHPKFSLHCNILDYLRFLSHFISVYSFIIVSFFPYVCQLVNVEQQPREVADEKDEDIAHHDRGQVALHATPDASRKKGISGNAKGSGKFKMVLQH
jgi:hypothetical protein